MHNEAVARLRQAGWLAVPYPPATTAVQTWTDCNGFLIAGALVPRCTDDWKVLSTLATRARADDKDGGEQELAASDLDAAQTDSSVLPVPAM